MVNPSTESVCATAGASCTKPTPFVLEALRSLGGSSYPWVKTNLTVADLDGLRGVDLELDLSYDPYVLYYASSGNGVYVSTVEW